MIKPTTGPSENIDSGWTTARLTVQVTFARSPTIAPRADRTSRVDERSDARPEDTTAQALVIGANVVSFQAGLAARERQDIVECLVLARLAATAKVKSPESLLDAVARFEEFVSTLSNLGFNIVERGIPELPQLAREFDVVDIMRRAGRELGNEEIQEWLLIATRALQRIGAGPRDSALARIVNPDIAQPGAYSLQTTAIGRDASGNVKLAAVRFIVEATTPLENILTSRFDRDLTRFDAAYVVFNVNMQVLEATRGAIAKRLDPLRPQIERYVRAFPDPIDVEAREP